MAASPPQLLETQMADPTDTTTSTASADGAATARPSSNGKTALSDAFREHFSGDAPFTDKVKSFAKAKPWASAALAGIAGIAVLSTLRGKRG